MLHPAESDYSQQKIDEQVSNDGFWFADRDCYMCYIPSQTRDIDGMCLCDNCYEEYLNRV